MSSLSIFNFQNSNVRVQLLNNEPLFCLTDVTSILNIKNANASRFNMSEDGIHKMYSVDSLNRKNEITYINEPNLYRVIFRSNKKEAIDFQNWVFDEVLPAIRKTGSYSLTINAEQQQLIQQAVNERAYRTGENHKAIYIKLHKEFKIPRYVELPASKFNDAIKFLGGIMSNKSISITESNLECLISHSLWIFNFWREKRLREAFKMIGSDFGIRMENHIDSCYSLSIGLKRELETTRKLTIQ